MDNINFLGYRFRPTEDEIITYFLERKMRGLGFPVHAINEVDLCKSEPWELPDKSALRDDEEWYFFSAPNRKYANSARVERTTNAGYWKVTGKDRPILDSCRKEVIGVKKHLVFYTGRGSDGVKTSWVIHEYHSNKASAYQKPFVLCRLKGNLDDKSKAYNGGESSRHGAFSMS
ncbi:NAC domain containing protein [Melia azedarach]|uniref:NAC domain containing protein n=1 Tax=Melia azedarach TaxID=155640 RepID=A0ACC1YXA8_MELAZ|nr:NAC domain containing protein [Melia azedarach]